jgi:hypothetical protein
MIRIVITTAAVCKNIKVVMSLGFDDWAESKGADVTAGSAAAASNDLAGSAATLPVRTDLRIHARRDILMLVYVILMRHGLNRIRTDAGKRSVVALKTWLNVNKLTEIKSPS